jgi:2-polyprenyl-3-methyl-5-hydroxy-6-metoxy-1,4-benzoquinol methylase
MRLPDPSELRDSDALYLYENDKHELFGRRGWRRYLYMNRFGLVLDFARRTLSENSVVVDVGSAQANFVLALANIGCRAYGIDIRSSFIHYARLKMNPTERNNVEFIVCDAKNTPLRENFADCVLLLEILEHTTQPDTMLKECLSILRKDAYLIVSTPNKKRIRNSKTMSWSDFKSARLETREYESSAKGWQHVFEFSESELLTFLSKLGLDIVDIETKTFMGFQLLARFLDHRILSVIEAFFFRLPSLREKFGMDFIVFCRKN